MAKSEEWESKEVVNHQVRVADITIPGRRDKFAIVARLALAFVSDQPRILDIGCGYGDVTAEILELSPLASICKVDFSEEVLQQAKERFGNNIKVVIIKHDLNNGVPDNLESNNFDAVVSCYALHHIEHENKVPFFNIDRP